MVNPYRFYTYAYLREDGTPYYIGKGSGKRLYKKYKGEISPPKDKSKIILLKVNLTEEEAFKHEKYMIDIFGRKDISTGILRNKTFGGEGSSGRIVSQKQISILKKVGKECVKNKLGIHGCNDNFMKHSRMKGSMKSKESCSKPFKVKDLNGNVIEGKNITEFCRKFGFSQGNFTQMLNGTQRVAYGYVLPETKIKNYRIISPEGIKFTLTEFDNFTKFCDNHNLYLSSFCRMLKKKFSHKGWKVLEIFYT